MIKFLEMGQEGLERANKAIDFFGAKGGNEETLDVDGGKILYGSNEVNLKAPVTNPPAMFFLMFTSQGALDIVVEPTYGVTIQPIKPVIPAWFFKPIQCLTAPDDYVIRPTGCEMLLNSPELAVVIGKRAFRISKEEVYDYIAGYTICNDVTCLDFLPKEQLTFTMNRSKVFPTFAPVGPYICTKDSIPDVHSLVMEAYIDDELMRSWGISTYEMKPEDIVVHAANHIPLDVGTIISMGGFPGTADIQGTPGHTMGSRLERVGMLRNPVISEEEAIAKGWIPKPYYCPGEKDY